MSTTLKEWLVKTIAELSEERDAVPGAVNEDATMALAAMKLALASLEAKPVAYMYKDNLHSDARFSLHTRFGNWSQEDINEYEITEIPLYAAPPAPVSVPDVVSWEDVPEEITEDDIALASAWAHGFNQCRAAMLQGADEKPEITVWYGSMPESNGKANWTAILHRKGEAPCMDGFTIDRSEYPGRVLYAADRVRYLIGEKSERPSILDYDADAHSGYVKPGNSPVIPDGWCRTCRPVTISDMRFVVCPECGNKRCPHANDHRNACTGSNEPGQEGSAYPAAPQQEVTQALAKGMERYGDAMRELAKKEEK